MIRFTFISLFSWLLATSTCSAQYAGGFVVAGFDQTRQGVHSLDSPTGQGALVRSAILGSFPGVTIQTAPTLTPAFLVPSAFCFISCETDSFGGIAPLSSAEQAALVQRVSFGGSAIISLTHGSWNPNGPAIISSILSAFGIAAGPDIIACGATTATFPNPASSPVTSGPFGTFDNAPFCYSGSIGTGPSSMAVLGTYGSLPVIAEIPPQSLSPTSGRVLVLADEGFLNAVGLILNMIAATTWPCNALGLGQANSPGASMVLNLNGALGCAGAISLNVLPGGALFFRLKGSPGAPFALGFSPSAPSGSFPIGNGFTLDIGNPAVGFSDIVFLANGYALPFSVLGPDGVATLNLWLPPNLTSGLIGGFQAAIGASVALTAAFYVSVF